MGRYLDPTPLLDVIEHRAAEVDLRPDAFMRLKFGQYADRSLHRWRGGESITIATADRIACALGLHPANVWPDWYGVAV